MIKFYKLKKQKTVIFSSVKKVVTRINGVFRTFLLVLLAFSYENWYCRNIVIPGNSLNKWNKKSSIDIFSGVKLFLKVVSNCF